MYLAYQRSGLYMKSYFYRLKRFGVVKNLKFITILFTLTVILDIYNIPTKAIKRNGLFPLIVMCFGILLILIAFLFENHIQGLVSANTINEFDTFIVTSAFFNIIYLVLMFIPSLFKWYKIIILIVMLLVLVGLLFYRIIINKDKKIKTSHKSTNIYDLKEFIDRDIALENEYPILLVEKDVDYDLFDRSIIINKLYSSIMACHGSDYSYVIGLEGPWGSGKTTIIKNVIKRIKNEKINNLLIVSDFDPWIYCTEEALLIALFDAILRNTGIKYSNATLKNITNGLIKSVMGEDIATKVASSIVLFENEENIVINLKEKIHDFLKHNDLTLVVFIDNLDRASASNITFLLKIISKIFDLDRIVYVLAYDRERINSLLSENSDINKHYIEKIVQQEIRIPKLNKNSFRIIVGDCLKKLFEINGINSVDQEEYSYIVEFLINNCEDIRAFKRIINSVGTTLNIDSNLYKPDLLSLEIVRFFNNDLYEEIHRNPEYYVSADYIMDINLYRNTFNRERFNTDGKEYYRNLKEKFEISLLEFLSNVFPYVKRGLNGDELRPEYDFDSSKINKQIALKCRASSAKYFDLYFYYGQNEYTAISQIYKIFINSIHEELSNNTTENIPDLFEALFNEIPIYYQDEIINKLWFEREDFSKNLNLPIFVGLISNSAKIDKESGFFMLSPYQRTCSIMASLFSLISNKEKNELLEFLKNKYQYLNVIDGILYWLDSSSNNFQMKNIDIQSLGELLSNMYKDINNNNINIYDDEYYAFHNSWTLMRIKRRKLNLDNDDEINIIEYISSISSANNIYKIACDLIEISTGTDGYNYYLTEKNIKCFFACEDELFEFLENNPPHNETEEFIYRVCEEYKTGTANNWGRRSVQSDNPIRFW